jgi:hypothetical protein
MNPVQAFIRNHYSDAQAIRLLDDCRNGSFRYASCDCLLGRTVEHVHETYEHLYAVRQIIGALEAENELAVMMFDHIRMDYLIPVCEAEIAHRANISVEAVAV